MNETLVAEQTDPFAGEEIAALIEWLALEEGAEWQAAARSLYVRYYEWLFRRLYEPLKNSGYLEDIVLETFWKGIRHISKFRIVEGEEPKDTRARFEAWLLKIGKHLMLDHLRKANSSETRDSEFWERVSADMITLAVESPPSMEVEAVRETVGEFSNREQVILRAWMQYSSDIDNPQAKLPRSVLDDLSASLNTTKANIRTIKSRALPRFKARLQEKGIHL